MGMAKDEFVSFLEAHVGYVKVFLLPSEYGIEDDVLQHVAQFLANVLRVVVGQGIAQFVNLLNSVGPQRFACGPTGTSREACQARRVSVRKPSVFLLLYA